VHSLIVIRIIIIRIVAHPERIQKNISLMKGIGGSITILGILPVNLYGKIIPFRVVQDLPIAVDGFLSNLPSRN